MTILESVRDYDCYILNTCAGEVNTSLMELCIMIHACKVSLLSILPSQIRSLAISGRTGHPQWHGQD